MSDDENPFGDASPTSQPSAMDKLLALRSASLRGGAGGASAEAAGAANPFAAGGGGRDASSSSGGSSSGGGSSLVAPPRPLWQSCGQQLIADRETDVSLDEERGLPSEIQVFADVKCMVRSALGDRVMGSLLATTYQLRFRPDGALPARLRHLPRSYFSVPMASIRKLERFPASAAGPGGVELVCKDARTLTLCFEKDEMSEMMHMRIKMIAYPPKVELVFAFGKALPAPHPGWEVYTPAAEWARLGVTSVRHPASGEPLYRVSDTNREFGFCPTYPASLAFPARASDAFMAAVAEFRSKARVPALTWLHPAAKTSLWRCSQPKVGMSNKKCTQDEELLQMIRDNNLFTREGRGALLLVADCRPQTNARANLAMGGGYENYPGTQLEFCA